MHYSDDDLKRIYLQLGKTEEDDDWDDEVGVTWCVDRINDSDVEYVRQDVAAKVWEALEYCWCVMRTVPKDMRRVIADRCEMRYIIRGLLDPDASMDYSIEALELGHAMLEATK